VLAIPASRALPLPRSPADGDDGPFSTIGSPKESRPAEGSDSVPRAPRHLVHYVF